MNRLLFGLYPVSRPTFYALLLTGLTAVSGITHCTEISLINLKADRHFIERLTSFLRTQWDIAKLKEHINTLADNAETLEELSQNMAYIIHSASGSAYRKIGVALMLHIDRDQPVETRYYFLHHCLKPQNILEASKKIEHLARQFNRRGIYTIVNITTREGTTLKDSLTGSGYSEFFHPASEGEKPAHYKVLFKLNLKEKMASCLQAPGKQEQTEEERRRP